MFLFYLIYFSYIWKIIICKRQFSFIHSSIETTEYKTMFKISEMQTTMF
jgi:hypothetical protein